MAKVAAKAEMDFRNNLKRVQSTKFKMSDDEKEVSYLSKFLKNLMKPILKFFVLYHVF